MIPSVVFMLCGDESMEMLYTGVLTFWCWELHLLGLWVFCVQNELQKSVCRRLSWHYFTHLECICLLGLFCSSLWKICKIQWNIVVYKWIIQIKMQFKKVAWLNLAWLEYSGCVCPPAESNIMSTYLTDLEEPNLDNLNVAVYEMGDTNEVSLSCGRNLWNTITIIIHFTCRAFQGTQVDFTVQIKMVSIMSKQQ